MQRHIVLPHHIYPSVNRDIGRQDARRALGWPQDIRVVLAFGCIRADEERVLIMKMARELRHDRIKVISPRLFQQNITSRKNLHKRLRFIRYGLYLGKYGPVDVDTMSRMFAACDVVMIPRKHILNSGNLSMGFYFGKVVVGPDLGNVGEILRATGNPVFDPGDIQSVCNAIREGVAACEANMGKANRQYADDRWGPDKVANDLIESYRTLLESSEGQ